MSFCRLIAALALAPALGACASPAMDLAPAPPTEGALKVSKQGEAKLQVMVQNLGTVPTEASPVTIEFYLPKLIVTSMIQDGGPVLPGEASRILEFEVPKDCLELGCDFLVAVDPKRELGDEHRSNNRVRGRCEGQTMTQYVPQIGSQQPQED